MLVCPFTFRTCGPRYVGYNYIGIRYTLGVLGIPVEHTLSAVRVSILSLLTTRSRKGGLPDRSARPATISSKIGRARYSLILTFLCLKIWSSNFLSTDAGGGGVAQPVGRSSYFSPPLLNVHLQFLVHLCL